MTYFLFIKDLERVGGHAEFSTKLMCNLFYEKDGYRKIKKLNYFKSIYYNQTNPAR